MFTGIVEESGEVLALRPREGGALLQVSSPPVARDAAVGDSVAVNGVCVTVMQVSGNGFDVDLSTETLRRTSLGDLESGAAVNLERPLTLSARLGGHLVQGHVDGVGTVAARSREGAGELMRISLPDGLDRYLVEKGSIAVDGVSLTVVDSPPGAFTVSLIPTTLELTTLGRKHPGDPVNLEVDVLAKYVAKLLEARP